MNTVQSVIVYRNPAEAALWEGGFVIPLMAAGLTAVAAMLILHTVVQRISWIDRPSRRRAADWACAAGAAVAAGFAFHFTFI